MNNNRVIAFLCYFCLLFSGLIFTQESVLAGESAELVAGWEGYINTGDSITALEKFKEAFRKEPDKMKIASAYSQLLIQSGEYQQSAEVLIKSFNMCEWDDWCEPAIADLDSIVEYIQDITPLEEMLQKRLGNSKLSWIEHRLVSELLIKVKLIQEELDESQKIAAEQHYVDHWLAIGPFSNRNQQEFLVAHDLEKEFSNLDLTKKWQGRGRKIAWEKLPVPWNGRLNLGMIQYPSDESISYLLTYIKSSIEQDVVLALEESGASALWLNNELIYVDSAYVNSKAALQRMIDAKLRPGLNQLVLKLASGRGTLAQARLQVVSGNVAEAARSGSYKKSVAGNIKLVNGVSAELNTEYLNSKNNSNNYKLAKFPVLRQGDGWGTAGALWGALIYFDELANNESLGYNNALGLMNMGYLVNHYGFDSTEHSRERYYDSLLLEKYQRCPLFMISAAYTQIGDNGKLALLKKAFAISSQEKMAQDDIIQLLLSSGFEQEARRKATELIAAGEGSFTLYNVLAQVAEINKWFPEASRYYQQAVQKLPGAGWLYARIAANSNSATEAITVLMNGRKRVFDIDLAEALAGWLYKEHRFEESEALYQQILSIDKYTEDYWDAAAACMVARGNLPGAVKIFEEGIYWMPQNPVLREKLGRVLLRAGRRKEGIEFLQESLAIQGDNPNLTAYIKELSSNEQEFYTGEELAYDDLAGKDATADMYPDFDKLCILDQKYVVVAANATKKQMVRTVTKVLRESAINSVSTLGIYYDSSRQKVEVKHARVIQPTGEITENPVIRDGSYSNGGAGGAAIYDSAQVRSVQLSAVQKGSIVDVMYTIEDTAENMYHDEFSENVYLGKIEPTVKFVYTAVVPEAMGVEYSVYKSAVKPAVENIKGGNVKYTMSLENIAGVKFEPRMPPLEEIKPALMLSSFKDWQDLGYWASGLFDPAMVLPDDIKLQVKEIVQGAENRDEKIAAIYDYVTKNIRYVSISYGKFGYMPHKAERTFRSGYGDCKDTAALLATMLKEVGVEAYPTLVRTNNQGKILSDLPSPELFNHSIAYVPAPKDGSGKHYWLDGTTDFFVLGMIPAMDRGTESLIIKPEGELLKIDELQPQQEQQISNATFVINKDGSGKLIGKEVYKGRNAVGMKRIFEKPEVFFNSFKQFINGRFTGATVGSFEHSGNDENANIGWFSYIVSGGKMALKDGAGLKLLPRIFPVNLTNITTLKNRNYDLMLGAPRIYKSVIKIELEDGLKFENLIEDVKIEIDGVSYIREVKRIERGVEISYVLAIKEDRIKKEDYTEFRKFVNLVAAKTSEWVFMQQKNGK